MKVVNFRADDSSQEACIQILEDALRKAKDGTIVDVAVVSIERGEDGPEFHIGYHAEAQYGLLIAGASALTYHLHAQGAEG